MEPEPVRLRAAQYARMSTERQDLSLEFQMAENRRYAESRGYELVRAYTDAGISGLTIERRPGLKSLVADVLSGEAGFEAVLVYDVSRWGRFQDPDQAAHYEFICREAGIKVEYSAEPFQNDGSLSDAILKSVKRAMAAEYSRHLSVRCSRARRAVLLAGYWPGGSVGYGYRRAVESRGGKLLGVLGFGEPRPIGARTRIVLGPPEEVATVRRIYRLFLHKRMSVRPIADLLNSEGVPSERGGRWSNHLVWSILAQRKYCGTPVFNRVHSPLGTRLNRPTDPDQWIAVKGGSPAIVSEARWRAAQLEFERRKGAHRDELLDHLRVRVLQHGRFRTSLLTGRWGFGVEQYRSVFGSSLLAAFEAGVPLESHQLSMLRHLVQKSPETQARVLRAQQGMIVQGLRRLLWRHGRLTARIIDRDQSVPHTNAIKRVFGDMITPYLLAGYRPEKRQSVRMLMRGREQLSLEQARERADSGELSCAQFAPLRGSTTHQD